MSQQVGVQGPGTLNEQVKQEALLASQDVNASGNSSSIDGLNKGTMIFAFNIGTPTGTSPTLDAKVQESDDDSTFTDAAATDMFSGAAVAIAQQTAAGFVQLVVDRRKLKRYLRIAYTLGGTTPVFPLGITVATHDTARGKVS